MERYRVLSHTADTAIEADAPTLDRLVENLAYGMFDLMFDLGAVRSEHFTEIEVSAATTEELVVDVISELLYRAETSDLVFCSFAARVDAEALRARVMASGSSTDRVELRGPPIKAVTYHDLVVARRDDAWYGRVLFDV